MKWLSYTALVVLLFGALCAEGAGEIERQIVGTWEQATPNADHSEWTITYDAGGAYRVSIAYKEGTHGWMSGSWHLEGAVLVLSATDASDLNSYGVPHILKFTIQRITEDEVDFDFWPDLRFPKKYRKQRVNQPLQGTPAKAPSSSTEPEGRRS